MKSMLQEVVLRIEEVDGSMPENETMKMIEKQQREATQVFIKKDGAVGKEEDGFGEMPKDTSTFVDITK